jgi:hypothetical protein
MMTQQLGFSILTAPLAAIDRRALSQAWYSALHLASPPAVREPAGARVALPRSSERALHPHGAVHRSHRTPSIRFVPVQPGARGGCNAAGLERRAPRSPLARRIERCFLDPARRVERASFTLSGGKSRVHVALQSSADGLRLIAVCPPSVRDAVSHAQARYALAARGIAFAYDVTEMQP